MKQSISLLIVLILFSCGKKQPAKAAVEDELIRVVPVNYPLYYFAERIGGDLIELAYPIPSGIDPAYWNPDEQALALYQSADLILDNGADYAKWMNNVSLPSSKVINTCSGLSKELIPLEQMQTHSHGSQGEHQHAGLAFTTWLNFDLATKQAAAIKNELIKRFPEKSEELTANFEALRKDLQSLHSIMGSEAKRLEGQTLIASHPVYQYMAAEYKLNLQSVHFEPDEMPATHQWAELDQLIQNLDDRIMIWEGPPNDQIKNELNKRNIQVIVFEPCGNKPDTGGFLTVMNGNLNNLKGVELKN